MAACCRPAIGANDVPASQRGGVGTDERSRTSPARGARAGVYVTPLQLAELAAVIATGQRTPPRVLAELNGHPARDAAATAPTSPPTAFGGACGWRWTKEPLRTAFADLRFDAIRRRSLKAGAAWLDFTKAAAECLAGGLAGTGRVARRESAPGLCLLDQSRHRVPTARNGELTAVWLTALAGAKGDDEPGLRAGGDSVALLASGAGRSLVADVALVVAGVGGGWTGTEHQPGCPVLTVTLEPGQTVMLGREALRAPQADSEHILLWREVGGGWRLTNIATDKQVLWQPARGGDEQPIREWSLRAGAVFVADGQTFPYLAWKVGDWRRKRWAALGIRWVSVCAWMANRCPNVTRIGGVVGANAWPTWDGSAWSGDRCAWGRRPLRRPVGLGGCRWIPWCWRPSARVSCCAPARPGGRTVRR